MGLTRTKFSQANTAVARIQDPITVLNNEATVANVDVGFLINRNHGIKSNVALYWSETGTEFVSALTSNTGVPDANITVSSYANIRAGSIFANIGGAGDIANVYITGSLIPSSNVAHDLGTVTDRFRSLWLSGNTLHLGSGNVSVNNDNFSFSTPAGTIALGLTSTLDTLTLSNLTVTSNLTLQGTQFIANTTDVAYVDSVLELHTQPNLAPLTSNDGRDIGFKFHYYDYQDEHAFLGRANDTGYLEWYDTGREGVGNVFSGNTYGTIKSGGLVLANTTVSTSTTTGAFTVAGGAGIAGNLYVNNIGDVSANIGTVIVSVNTVNANLGSFQLYANANAAGQQTTIDTLVSNAATQYTEINTFNANLGSYQTYANANAGVQSTDITNIVSGANSNVAAYLLTATGNIAASNLNLTGNVYGGLVPTVIYKDVYLGTTAVSLARGSAALTVDNLNTTGYATQANLASLATNATKTTVTSNVLSGTAYVTFVPAVTGNVDQNVNTALTYNPNSGNLSAYGLITTSGVFWSNGTAWSSGGGGMLTASNTAPASPNDSDFWYKISDDILLQYINDGTSSYWIDIQSSILFANTVGTAFAYGNTDVAAYLTTASITTTGNVGAGNVSAGGYFFSNGTPFTSSTYGNTQVQAYTAGRIWAQKIFWG